MQIIAQDSMRRPGRLGRRTALAGVFGALCVLALWAFGAAAHVAVSLMEVDQPNKTVTLHLVAAETDENNGFNFNGFDKGQLTITVPVGWTVKGDFVDLSPIPHSALVVPWDQREAASDFTVAFPGAATANYLNGIAKGDAAQTFSFVADKAGQYALICGVPGHAIGGMWDKFVVSDTASAPSVEPASALAAGASSESVGGSGVEQAGGPAAPAATGEATPHAAPGFVGGWLLPFIGLIVILILVAIVTAIVENRSVRR